MFANRVSISGGRAVHACKMLRKDLVLSDYYRDGGGGKLHKTNRIDALSAGQEGGLFS